MEAADSSETSVPIHKAHCVLSHQTAEPQILYSKACEIILEALESLKKTSDFVTRCFNGTIY
jgi:hypothetical protein